MEYRWNPNDYFSGQSEGVSSSNETYCNSSGHCGISKSADFNATNPSNFDIIKSKTGELAVSYVISVKYNENGREGYIVASDSRSISKNQNGMLINDNYKKIVKLNEKMLMVHTGFNNFSTTKAVSLQDLSKQLSYVHSIDELAARLEEICVPVCKASNNNMYFFLYDKENLDASIVLSIFTDGTKAIRDLKHCQSMGVQLELTDNLITQIAKTKAEAYDLAVYLTQYAIIREHSMVSFSLNGRGSSFEISSVGGDICVFDINEDKITEYTPIHNVLQQDYFSKSKEK